METMELEHSSSWSDISDTEQSMMDDGDELVMAGGGALLKQQQQQQLKLQQEEEQPVPLLLPKGVRSRRPCTAPSRRSSQYMQQQQQYHMQLLQYQQQQLQQMQPPPAAAAWQNDMGDDLINGGSCWQNQQTVQHMVNQQHQQHLPQPQQLLLQQKQQQQQQLQQLHQPFSYPSDFPLFMPMSHEADPFSAAMTWQSKSTMMLQHRYEAMMTSFKGKMAHLVVENSELRCELKSTKEEMNKQMLETEQNMQCLTSSITDLRESLLRCHKDVVKVWDHALHKMADKSEVSFREAMRIREVLMNIYNKVVNQAGNCQDPKIKDSIAKDLRKLRQLFDNYSRINEDFKAIGRTYEDRMTRSIDAYRKFLDSKDEELQQIRKEMNARSRASLLLQQARESGMLLQQQQELQQRQEQEQQRQEQLQQQQKQMQEVAAGSQEQLGATPQQHQSETTATVTFAAAAAVTSAPAKPAAADAPELVPVMKKPTELRKKGESELSEINERLREKLDILQSYIRDLEKGRERTQRHNERRVKQLTEQLKTKEESIQIQLSMQRAQIMFELKSSHQADIERVTDELQQKYTQYMAEQKRRADELLEQYRLQALQGRRGRGQGQGGQDDSGGAGTDGGGGTAAAHAAGGAIVCLDIPPVT